MTVSRRGYRYPLARPHLDSEVRESLLKAYDSGWISSKGEFIQKFERGFSSFVGSRYGVATSNGTTALHLALKACEIHDGDEVIVPDFSFVAVANAVTYTGAKPILVDVNRQYWGLDVDAVRRAFSKRTKAVLVVHLYGHPVNLNPIKEFCERESLYLIEDCAEAHGARYKGKIVGSAGIVSCFSFYGNKILTTGEGGMCLTNDESLDLKMRILRDHGAGSARHFWHKVIGFNYRMTNLQAAIGYAQLKTLEKKIAKYRQIGRWYTARLGTQGIEPHPEMDWAQCVYWMYTVMIDRLNPNDRPKLQYKLAQRGIETRPSFYQISKLPPYVRFKVNNRISMYLANHGVSLPTYFDLSEENIEEISNILLSLVKSE